MLAEGLRPDLDGDMVWVTVTLPVSVKVAHTSSLPGK
jgi:hypothetical protein